MSHLSDNIAFRAGQQQAKIGTSVLYNGQPYTVNTEQVSAAQVGADKLPVEGLGPYIASADPRVFRFLVADFAPTTSVCPPQEGSELVWHALKYHVTHVTYDDIDQDTNALLVYAYREIL